jgi:hypothetical protein
MRWVPRSVCAQALSILLTCCGVEVTIETSSASPSSGGASSGSPMPQDCNGCQASLEGWVDHRCPGAVELHEEVQTCWCNVCGQLCPKFCDGYDSADSEACAECLIQSGEGPCQEVENACEDDDRYWSGNRACPSGC